MNQEYELLIKQLDGTNEAFKIICMDDIDEDDSPSGKYNYSIYKDHRFKCFSLNIVFINERFYIRHVHNNYHKDYERKNIVFAALSFIADQHESSIYSSAMSPEYSFDETDRIVPETMGERWPKMLERYPERVEYLAQEHRYVMHPARRQSAVDATKI